MAFELEFKRCQDRVEQRLSGFFEERVPQGKLLEAMRYSLLAGGKRIRPVLTLKFCEAAGGDLEKALPVACAVEMLHTYSLIHDDLPCMDNDDLRRGCPTNHKVFGEMTAILAGDALQSAAFEAILSAPLGAEERVNCALSLAKAAGALGMCGGQQLDKEGEKRRFSQNEVKQMNALKTGALLRSACEMGVLSAGVSREDSRCQAARDYAEAVGLAFQIQDDVLNATSTAEEMGKPVGSDATLQKSTYVSLLGVEACRHAVARLTAEAKEAIRIAFPEPDFLVALADYLARRDH